MKKIVISQPMLFPWIGLFEQIRLADSYVHYDDVQFSKGSFVNRVQIKTVDGSKWLTVPLDGIKLGQEIREVRINDRQNWRESHLNLLKQVYAKALYKQDMLDLVSSVYSQPATTICDLSINSILAICKYFNLARSDKFLYSSRIGLEGTSSERVLDIVKYLDGNIYITGHGAKNYLDHFLFEESNINVEYMDYRKNTYPQLHGEFTPYVSTLDLIANVGTIGKEFINSETIYWKEAVK
ncbi:WbqC family protein [Chamaesiphon minutus]|uniref:WbqC-like protein n=1 Tax=Chamaesiphon minutus (strain ATCC 27169 / PCC 6605) TaxID=1173020 RepID=K9UHT0_CHAP6|nr:WbqC family protein [Chamaesiphon minutus]AFY94667.1 WbqC-like protein [Chamaesiphon minutus PCC 6605]